MLGWLRSADWGAPLGLIRIDDAFVEVIRRRVQTKISGMKIHGRSREAAEREIEQASRHETLAVFREVSPSRNHTLRPTWPLADCFLCDDGLAVIKVWIGHDYQDGGDGVSPIRTPTMWRLRGTVAKTQ